MKSSGSSWASATPPSPAGSPRRNVGLAGRSTLLDPRRNAVRPDLADIRLAGQVFAAHYADPLARVVTRAAPLRAERDADAETLATLQPGAAFELLDLVGGDAWGRATDEALVGYVEAEALARP